MAIAACLGTPAAYTPAETADVLVDGEGNPATGDYCLVEWDASLEGSSHTITIYTDGTITQGGSVSGKVGHVVRIESGDNGARMVPIRGASQVAAAGSTAFGAGTRLKVGSL